MSRNNGKKIRLSKKWVNPLFWEIDKWAKDSRVAEVYVYGGKGSSKSWTLAQYVSLKGYTKNKSTLAFRKESSRIKLTLKKTFKGAIESMRLKDCYEHLDFKFRGQGYEISLTGLDDPEKAKGVEGFDYVLMDELNQFSKEEHEQVALSLRGKEGQILFGTWNPVSEDMWVKTELIDSEEWIEVDHTLPSPDSYVKVSSDGTKVLIKTDYRDNYWAVGSPCGTYGFVDDKLIKKYERLKTLNHHSWLVNVKGEWGQSQNEKPWLYDFKKDRHLICLLYTSPSPRDATLSRMPSSA